MITGTVWGVTLYIVGIVSTIAATQVFLGALFPARLAATRHALRERPAISAIVGVFAFGIPLLLSILVAQKVQLAGAIGISAISLVAVFGLGAVALEVGARLPSSGDAATGWRAMIRGSVVVSLASLLPVAGWFLVWPLTVFAGTGAWAIGLFTGTRAGAPSSAHVPHAAAEPRSVPAPAAAEPAEITA